MELDKIIYKNKTYTLVSELIKENKDFDLKEKIILETTGENLNKHIEEQAKSKAIQILKDLIMEISRK